MKTELDIFKVLYEIVKGWPASHHSNDKEKIWNRLNTFAVLDSDVDMYSENLGKDARYKPEENNQLFFCRRWANSGYRDEELQKDLPALLIWPEPGEIKGSPFICEDEVIKFRLCFQAKYVAAYDPGSVTDYDGTQRPREVIISSLRTLRTQLHRELGKWIYADVFYTAGTSDRILINQAYLSTLIGSTVASYSNVVYLTTFLSLEDNETSILTEFDANGLLQLFSSFSVRIQDVADVAINHSAVEPAEKLDHPNNSGA